MTGLSPRVGLTIPNADGSDPANLAALLRSLGLDVENKSPGVTAMTNAARVALTGDAKFSGRVVWCTDTAMLHVCDGTNWWPIVRLTTDGHLAAGDTWDSWTPTITGWTQGNGTLSNCMWTRIGDTVHATATFTLGSTTTVGHPLNFSLPVGGVVGHTVPQPHAYLLDAGTNSYYGACRTDGSVIQVGGPPTADGAGTALSSTFPFTWAAGDTVSVNVTYLAVS